MNNVNFSNQDNYINLRILYNYEIYVENLKNKEELEIAGKKLVKTVVANEIDGETINTQRFIYSTDDNYLIIISIDSKNDNVDSILKDFLKFEFN